MFFFPISQELDKEVDIVNMEERQHINFSLEVVLLAVFIGITGQSTSSQAS
jgi:hypothetical protein